MEYEILHNIVYCAFCIKDKGLHDVCFGLLLEKFLGLWIGKTPEKCTMNYNIIDKAIFVSYQPIKYIWARYLYILSP
ncbi:MAG: hypothetical protein B6U72_02315 [Candidatus Altiarchaeales archaeon ex4484_2]|nr:MAG: hypothetical protein B6U72_02315 [Candidatus Altiarchaeales archaeon ex4484_2]